MDTLIKSPSAKDTLLTEKGCDEKQIFSQEDETYFTKAQIDTIKKGIEQSDNGLLIPYTEVRKKAREILCGN